MVALSTCAPVVLSGIVTTTWNVALAPLVSGPTVAGAVVGQLLPLTATVYVCVTVSVLVTVRVCVIVSPGWPISVADLGARRRPALVPSSIVSKCSNEIDHGASATSAGRPLSLAIRAEVRLMLRKVC